MWSSISPVHWKSLKSSLKTYHDVPNNILKEIIFFQKSYGNTTRLKILNTIKKKSVPFQAISGDLLLGQTRAQSQIFLGHFSTRPNKSSEATSTTACFDFSPALFFFNFFYFFFCPIFFLPHFFFPPFFFNFFDDFFLYFSPTFFQTF